MKIVTHFPLNSNKTPSRHYSFDAICLRLWGTGGSGGGGLAMEFPWAWNIFKNFLLNLCKGGLIVEGVNTFWKFYISLEVVRIKTWVLQVISKWRSSGEWTKVSAFPFEIQHNGVTSVYIWFTPFKLESGIHSPPGFSLLVSTNINQSCPIFLFNFLLWKHALIKMRKLVRSCWHIFHCIYIKFWVLTFSRFWYI